MGIYPHKPHGTVLTDHPWNAGRSKKPLGWDVDSGSAVPELDCAAQRTSAWMAPGVCMADILGRFRLCVDFREVKYISKFDMYLREALMNSPDKEIPIFPPMDFLA